MQTLLEQRQKRSVQLRQLHELQGANEQRGQRQAVVEEQLEGLQVGVTLGASGRRHTGRSSVDCNEVWMAVKAPMCSPAKQCEWP